MEKIKVTRKTTESEMNVVLDFAPLKKDYRKYIKTPIPFLNHMIEHIAWRGEVNIDVDLKLDEFVLTHVICEDLGIALGKAAKEYIDRTDGARGFGDAVGIIDEAKAECALNQERIAILIIMVLSLVKKSREWIRRIWKHSLKALHRGLCVHFILTL